MASEFGAKGIRLTCKVNGVPLAARPSACKARFDWDVRQHRAFMQMAWHLLAHRVGFAGFGVERRQFDAARGGAGLGGAGSLSGNKANKEVGSDICSSHKWDNDPKGYGMCDQWNGHRGCNDR